MYQLLLLGIGFTEEDKRYLYALEMSKRKILRVVKFDKDNNLWKNWKKGMITNVKKIEPCDFEEGTFKTYNEQIDMDQAFYLEKILLNTASNPENIVYCRTPNRFGLIRISDVVVENEIRSLNARIWAWENKCIEFDVDNVRWNSFWKQELSKDAKERYINLFASQRRKTFAVIESGQEKPVIVDFFVM